jgi:hypothetical protein
LSFIRVDGCVARVLSRASRFRGVQTPRARAWFLALIAAPRLFYHTSPVSEDADTCSTRLVGVARRSSSIVLTRIALASTSWLRTHGDCGRGEAAAGRTAFGATGGSCPASVATFWHRMKLDPGTKRLAKRRTVRRLAMLCFDVPEPWSVFRNAGTHPAVSPRSPPPTTASPSWLPTLCPLRW